MLIFFQKLSNLSGKFWKVHFQRILWIFSSIQSAPNLTKFRSISGSTRDAKNRLRMLELLFESQRRQWNQFGPTVFVLKIQCIFKFLPVLKDLLILSTAIFLLSSVQSSPNSVGFRSTYSRKYKVQKKNACGFSSYFFNANLSNGEISLGFLFLVIKIQDILKFLPVLTGLCSFLIFVDKKSVKAQFRIFISRIHKCS